MGFWHTGYAEFHEPSGLEAGFFNPTPVRYACEHCTQNFEDIEALRRHRFEEHPLRQPVLLVRGRAVSALPLKVVTPIQPSDVVVEDGTRCIVNGQALLPAEVGKYLSKMTREFVELEVLNSDANIRCKLDFRIADESHLVGVENAFLRMAHEGVLDIDAVSRFNKDCKPLQSAIDYQHGICQYLYGVMAKEQTKGSGLRYEEYQQKYVQAADVLSGFDRPLAHSIRALVAFHFNQFDEAEFLAPKGALRDAAAAFASLLQGLPWHFQTAFSAKPGCAVEDLLTDQDTLQILADASHGLVELRALAEHLHVQLRRASPGGYDRMKRVLLASEALAACEDAPSRVLARRLTRELAGRPDTKEWAEAMLERLKTP